MPPATIRLLTRAAPQAIGEDRKLAPTAARAMAEQMAEELCHNGGIHGYARSLVGVVGLVVVGGGIMGSVAAVEPDRSMAGGTI